MIENFLILSFFDFKLRQSFFCEFTTNESKITFLPSMELNAFRLLSEKYHFAYHAIDANGSYGRKEGDVWLGSIGHIVNHVSQIRCHFWHTKKYYYYFPRLRTWLFVTSSSLVTVAR